MIFKESYLKSGTVIIDGTDDSHTLYEINSLERAKVLDMTITERAKAPFVGKLEANIYLVCCSLRPGIDDSDFDFEKIKAELHAMPDRILTKLVSKAMEQSGFYEDEGEGK